MVNKSVGAIYLECFIMREACLRPVAYTGGTSASGGEATGIPKRTPFEKGVLIEL